MNNSLIWKPLEITKKLSIKFMRNFHIKFKESTIHMKNMDLFGVLRTFFIELGGNKNFLIWYLLIKKCSDNLNRLNIKKIHKFPHLIKFINHNMNQIYSSSNLKLFSGFNIYLLMICFFLPMFSILLGFFFKLCWLVRKQKPLMSLLLKQMNIIKKI